MNGALSPPEPLADRHEVGDFNSGETSLDDWLRRRARANQATGASRTYVVCEQTRVIGYTHSRPARWLWGAHGRFRRNMPDPIPVAVLARLAVDVAWQRHGIGRALFVDSVGRVIHAAGAIGIRGIVVHAISEGSPELLSWARFANQALVQPPQMVTLADARSSYSYLSASAGAMRDAAREGCSVAKKLVTSASAATQSASVQWLRNGT